MDINNYLFSPTSENYLQSYTLNHRTTNSQDHCGVFKTEQL
jgi:hypothetical protein